MQNFVVISTQRSGSRMVVESLSSHPDIICFGELFIPEERDLGEMFVPSGRENFLYREFNNDLIML